MSFLDFCFSSNWDRERERVVYKIWVWRRNVPKVTYLIFRRGSTGESFFFHGLIDFILFFFTLAWRTWSPSCLRYSFVFNPEYWLWFVCPLRTLLKKLTFLLFTSAEGKGSQLPFWGPSQSFGFSLLPLGVRRPEVTKYQHLLIPLCDLDFSLTVTFFLRLDTVNSTGR